MMRAVLATEGADGRDQLRQLLLGAGLECGPGDCVGFTDLPVRLSKGADVVLVYLGAAPDGALEAVRAAAAQTAAPVVAVGVAADPQLALQAMRTGAREFVDLSAFRDELPAALGRLSRAGAVKMRQGRVVAVVGAQPGCGVTTVACGLAFALAEKRPGAVALAELGAGTPELALDLDMKPPHPLEDLVRDWERLDGTMLRQALVAHAGGAHVLAHPAETLTATEVPAAALRQVALLLRSQFDALVLDLGHGPAAAAAATLLDADAVVVPVRLDVPGLRLARRFVARLVNGGLKEEKVRAVANRYGQSGQVAWREAEKALGVKVAVWAPDDPGTVNYALNHGQPLRLAAPGAKITRRLGELAALVAGKA